MGMGVGGKEASTTCRGAKTDWLAKTAVQPKTVAATQSPTQIRTFLFHVPFKMPNSPISAK
jgi:hypothetical protein